MMLSRRTLETLMDLIETRMSTIETWDEETERELRRLGACRRELMGARPDPDAPDILNTH